MPQDFYLRKKGPPLKQEQADKEDLQKFQVLRGRFIHWTSVLERIMKEKCSLVGEGKTFGQVKPIFLQTLKYEGYSSKEGFNSFFNALEQIQPERNSWAHGLLYYEPRDSLNLPNTWNDNDGNRQPTQNQYFDQMNTNFIVVINWLKSNQLWSLSDFEILEYHVDH